MCADSNDPLMETREKAFELDIIDFGIYCCMIMEEYCLEHSVGVVVFSQWIADNVKNG